MVNKTKNLFNNVLHLLDHNSLYLHSHLHSTERKSLGEVKEYLRHGLSGRPRRPIKQFKRLGPFLHVTFTIPNSNGCHNKINSKRVLEYRSAINKIIEDCFSENGTFMLGYHTKYHISTRTEDKSSYHFHALISRLRFDKRDDQSLLYFNNLDVYSQKLCATYFLKHLIFDDITHIHEQLLSKWLFTIQKVSKIDPGEIDEPDDLVNVNDNNGKSQDNGDRVKASKYVNNNALHTFRNVISVTQDHSKQKSNKVSITKRYLSPGGSSLKIYSVDTRDFVRDYLLNSNRPAIMRCYPKGFLNGNSKFGKIVDRMSDAIELYSGLVLPCNFLNLELEYLQYRVEDLYKIHPNPTVLDESLLNALKDYTALAAIDSPR